jgi:hypothetical protein
MANERVAIDLTMDGSRVTAAVGKAKKDISGLSGAAASVEQSFSKLGGVIAGALSVGAIAGFFAKINANADALADLAQRAGASAAGLQAIQLAVAQTGGEMDAVEPALKKMSVNIGEAMAGSKVATEAFKHLGLSVSELATLKSDQAFTRIIEKLSEIDNSSERAAAGTAILGKGYAAVAGLAAEGAKAIEDVNTRLDEQGARLSDLDTSKINVMNDALEFQGVVVENLGTKFLAGLAPAVGVATGTLATMLGKIGGATEAGDKFGIVMTAAIKMIEAGAYGLASVFETVRELIAKVLSVVTGMVSDLLSAFSILTGAVGLESMSAALKRGSDTMAGISESMHDIGVAASANADMLAASAKKAALDILDSAQIFAQAKTVMEQQAAAQAARNAAAQGAGTGYRAPITDQAAKQVKDNKVPGFQMSYDVKFATDQAGKAAAAERPADPLSSPEYLAQSQLNATMLALRDEYNASMAGKIDMLNQTTLGSLLSNHALQIQAEQYKNQTIGDMMGGFAELAMQQGGRLGAIGKAVAIAQTIWATGTAIMKAMAEVPFPANIGVAAMTAAMGVAQLANIKRTNIGSGATITAAHGANLTGGSAVSGSVPAATQPSAESQQKSATQIIINGNLFAAQETVDWLVGQISDAVNGRDMVFINGNSRQAMVLVGA